MMRQKTFLIVCLILLSGLVSALSAQTPADGAAAAVKPSVATGDVASLGANKIVLQTKDGAVEVVLSDKTEYKRVTPENPTLKAAVAASLADIGAGDRLVVTGVFSADKKTLPAKAVYLMTKSDIAQKQTKDSEQWRARGIAGKVLSVDAQSRRINVEVRGLTNASTVALTAKDGAEFKRYAPDSVKFSEAKTSSLAEVQAGDMIRALGDKSADGTAFAAEEIITGAFRTVAGTVKSVDAAKGEVVISDFQTKKDVTVGVGASATLKRFPEEMAQRMAQFQAMRAGGVRPGGQEGAARPPQTENPPAGGSAAGGEQGASGRPRGGFGGMRGGAAGGIDDLLERFPNITIGDLKAGDMIAVSSTQGAAENRITAIKLLAGVEPFLKSAPAAAGARRGGQGGQGGFTIPGLDGIDVP